MHAVVRNGSYLGLVLLLLVPLGRSWAVTAVVSQAVVGEPAPELSIPSLRPGHDPIHLADYRGKVVYLDFWSSWCAPCRRAMPHLDELRQAFSRKDFEVVGINVDALADDGRRFLERFPVSYPIAADAAGYAVRQFGVDVLPALFVIDRRGVVREAIQGAGVEARDDLRATLAKLIDEQEEVQ